MNDIYFINDVLLNTTSTSQIRSGYVRIKGCMLPKKYIDIYEAILNLEVREDDIWVCSFPKTGTTWTQEMVWMIANDVDLNGGQKILGKRFPFLELASIFEYDELMEKFPDFKPENFVADSVTFVKNMKGRRFIKTHLPWNLLPKQIQLSLRSPKIIYVVRNPKDAFISYYYHSKLMEGYTGDFDQFFKLYLEDKVNYAPFWSNVLQYWERRNQPNVLFITYEEMKTNLPEIMRTVSKFLGVTLSPDKMEQLAKHLSFESMKNNKSVNYEPAIEFYKKFNIITCDGTFMRCGKSDQHKSFMTKDMIQKFDNWILENTQGTDFPFYH